VRRIEDAETVIDPMIVSRLVGRSREANPLEALTQRERGGAPVDRRRVSNEAIAKRLSVTERTVEATQP